MCNTLIGPCTHIVHCARQRQLVWDILIDERHGVGPAIHSVRHPLGGGAHATGVCGPNLVFQTPGSTSTSCQRQRTSTGGLVGRGCFCDGPAKLVGSRKAWLPKNVLARTCRGLLKVQAVPRARAAVVCWWVSKPA